MNGANTSQNQSMISHTARYEVSQSIDECDEQLEETKEICANFEEKLQKSLLWIIWMIVRDSDELIILLFFNNREYYKVTSSSKMIRA